METRSTSPTAMSAGAQEPAEQWITHVLQQQPPLTAPATLEQRVFAAIAAAPPPHWWHQPLLGWPVAARVGFIAVMIACAGLGLALANVTAAFVGSMAITDHAAAAIPGYSAARILFDTLSALMVVARTLAGSLPQPWLHGGLLLVGLLYGVFFGLGAVGYRVLRPAR
jgi:hypothetical protein